MPTYRLTARNQFRSPSGAVGEAPDGPGAMATLLDDVDNYLGVGGAEYIGGAGASFASIPASRRFVGKLAYFQATDITYRYVGPGNAMGGGTAAWQAFSKPPSSYTPTWGGAIGGAAPSVNVGTWGISDGRLWVEALAVWNSGVMTLTGSIDATLSLPNAILAGLFNGTGTFFAGGATTPGSDIALTAHAPNGGATNQVRIRALAPLAATYAAGTPIRPQYLGNVGITPAASDTIQLQVSGPSAVVSTF